MTTIELARILKINSRTKRSTFRTRACYQHGISTIDIGDLTPVEQVLAALRMHAGGKPALMNAVSGLWRALTSGRVDPALGNFIQERYTPYQVCALVAALACEAPLNQGVAYIPEQWIPANADRIRARKY